MEESICHLEFRIKYWTSKRRCKRW